MTTIATKSLGPQSTVAGYGGGTFDPNGTQEVANGGASRALNVKTVGVVKKSPGRLTRVVIVAPGTSGNLTFNDSASTSGTTAANIILKIPFNATNCYAGSVISVDFPFVNGLSISAVGGAGSPIANVAFN